MYWKGERVYFLDGSIYRFALNLKPDNPWSFYKLGELHFTLGEMEDGLM
jgi:hypothetical protein